MSYSLSNNTPVIWQTSNELIEYPDAVSIMEKRIKAIQDETQSELVWALEHPALYTAGTSAKQKDLIDTERFPVFKTGRGGQYTYHGPGQLVVYFMLDLKNRGRDVRLFVHSLEQLIIDTLADFDVQAERKDGRIGVWVDTQNGEAKIAAIGVRIKRWVSLHGISININPDLSHFDGIIPCGISEHGVTSLRALGIKANRNNVEIKLKENFKKIFGPIKQGLS